MTFSLSDSRYLVPVGSHLGKLIALGRDEYGPECTPFWMASLDIRTGRYPADDTRPPHIGKRVYRNIDAPRGSSLYWDQPALVAAHNLSCLTGDPAYSQAVDAYVGAFLERCVANNGIFLWGNHYYYDAFRDHVVWFQGEEEPKPVELATENGWLHEIRPFSPAWDLLWRVSPAAVERAIRQIARQHLFDAEAGGFNRHADNRRSHAFLEAGGVLAETLCWLFAKAGDASLPELALRIAKFSWSHRSAATGLLESNPTFDRWDRYVATTEVGLWAGALLRAGDLSGCAEFQEMTRQAVAGYVRLGYDSTARRYYGRLRVADGSPDLSKMTTLYQPGAYSDLWNPLFPTHDYPMSLAESCLSLYQRTGVPLFLQAVERWAAIIRDEMPARGGRGAYAEHYGRCILFLCRAGQALGRNLWLDWARELADEAIIVLYAHGMFRGHPGEDRYDAVDGVGFLLLALIYLQTSEPPDYFGLGF